MELDFDMLTVTVAEIRYILNPELSKNMASRCIQDKRFLPNDDKLLNMEEFTTSIVVNKPKAGQCYLDFVRKEFLDEYIKFIKKCNALAEKGEKVMYDGQEREYDKIFTKPMWCSVEIGKTPKGCKCNVTGMSFNVVQEEFKDKGKDKVRFKISMFVAPAFLCNVPEFKKPELAELAEEVKE